MSSKQTRRCSEADSIYRGAFTDLLILWLPNFTDLSLRGYTWSKAHLLAMTAQGIDNKAMFTHLKYLDLRCKSEKSWLAAMNLRFPDLRAILQIRTLRSLAVDMIISKADSGLLSAGNPWEPSALTFLVSRYLEGASVFSPLL